MNGKIIGIAIAAALGLAGCAATTPTQETRSAYAIFDVQAGAGVGHAQLAEAVKLGLQSSTSQVRVVNGIPSSPLPEKAPRFRLVAPYSGNLAALAAASGQSLQVPVCDGAIVTANAADSTMRQYGEATTFFVCLMPYQGGYALNFYTTFSKVSGAFSAATLGATLARTVVGDSSQFIPRTINNVVEAVKATGATVTQVEAYP